MGKKCTRCAAVKGAEDFREGHGACKPCEAEQARERRAKKAKGVKAPGANTDMVRLEVMTKALSVSKDKVAIGWEGKREDLTLETADAVLVNARMDVRLDVEPDQEELFPGTKPSFHGIGDCSKVSVGSGTVSGRLSFARKGADLDTLLEFVGKEATLTATRLGFAGKAETGPTTEDDPQADPAETEADKAMDAAVAAGKEA